MPMWLQRPMARLTVCSVYAGQAGIARGPLEIRILLLPLMPVADQEGCAMAKGA